MGRPTSCWRRYLAAYPDVAKKFPSSPEEIAKLKLINWNVFHQQYPHAVDLWNRKITIQIVERECS